MQTAVLAGLCATVALWTGATVFVLANRAVYDRRERRLTALARTLVDPATASLPATRRHATIERVLARLSRRAVYRLVADERAPARLAESYAAYAIGRWGVHAMMLDASAARRRRKWRRVSALFALGRIGSPGVHELLHRAVCDRDPDVSAAAMVILRQLGDREAAACLVSALCVEDLPASRVATQLDRFPIAIDDLLRPLLHDARPRPRRWAASLLRRYPDAPWLAPEMVRLARDPDAQVRKEALMTLGHVGAVAAPAAALALEDPTPYVRSTAIRALGNIGVLDPDDRKRAAFASSIARRLGDVDWDVRLAAKEALLQLGPSIRDAVAAALHSADGFARDGAAEVLQHLEIIDSLPRPDDREALTS